MKARHEFATEEEYKSYLRIYLAGQAIAAGLSEKAVYIADQVLNALSKK